MSPFLQLRVWWREAPGPERQIAMVAMALVVALVAWALVPGDTAEDEGALVSSGAPAGGAGPVTTVEGAGAPSIASGGGDVAPSGATATGGAGAAESATAPTGAAGAPAAASSGGTAAAQSCSGLGNSDQGVTATQVHLGVGIFDLGGSAGNQVAGYRDDSAAIIGAFVDDINKRGGIACRKLVVSTYKVNPLDANDQRSKCLQAAQDKVFAFIDGQGMVLEASQQCLTVENKIPLIAPVALPESFFAGQGGYLIGVNASGNQQIRNAVLGAANDGTFEPAKGFKKVGILDDRCAPEFAVEAKQLLRQARVTEVDQSTLDCSGFIAPPNQIQQAVLQHKNAGVTHVLALTSNANLQVYTSSAQQLAFKPRYLGGDMYGNTSPSLSKNFDPNQYDGTVAYSVHTFGATAAKVPLQPAAQRCSQLMTSNGLPGISEEGKDDPVLWYCDEFALLEQMAKRTPAAGFTRRAFVSTLSSVGRIPFARTSDGVYDRPGRYWGASGYRKIQWQRDCTCWRVVDPNFRPNL